MVLPKNRQHNLLLNLSYIPMRWAIAPMVRNANAQTLVLITRTICAATDTEKSSVAHNSWKISAEFVRNEQKLFRCEKPVFMG